MGCWDSGSSFCNDDSLDWLEDTAASASSVSAVKQTLSKATSCDYLFSSDCYCITTAAELVAIALDQYPDGELPTLAVEVAQQNRTALQNPEMVDLAVQSLSILLTSETDKSDLANWNAEEFRSLWYTHVSDLRDRLVRGAKANGAFE